MGAVETDVEPRGGVLACRPGELWARVREQARRALEAGAMVPLATRGEVIREADVPFSLRRVSTLREKEAAGRRKTRNPFLPPDPELIVGALSPTHVAVLNRFPVLPYHLLAVTREYEEQELPLTSADFDALARLLVSIDGLAFYNSSPEAGASQAHRHLQIVPFPVGDGPAPTPIEGVLSGIAADPSRATLPIYAFRHAVAPLPETAWCSEHPVERAAQAMALAYRALARRAGVALTAGQAASPYNLLVTRRWMMIVPRSRERFEGVSVNALGFAGSFLVRDREQLEVVRSHGPLAVLRGVAIAWEAPSGGSGPGDPGGGRARGRR